MKQLRAEFIQYWIENREEILDVLTDQDSELSKLMSIVPGSNLLIDQNANASSLDISLQRYDDRTLRNLRQKSECSISMRHSQSRISNQSLDQSMSSFNMSSQSRQSEPVFQVPRQSNDVKVKRGLGILEELILEKNPNFYKEQSERERGSHPKGVPVEVINKRLNTQIRTEMQSVQTPGMQSSAFVPIPKEVQRPLIQQKQVHKYEEEEKKGPPIKQQNLSNQAKQNDMNMIFEQRDYSHDQKIGQQKLINQFNPILSKSPQQSFLSQEKQQDNQIFQPDQLMLQQNFGGQELRPPPSMIDESSILANPIQLEEDESSIMYPYTYQKRIVEKVLLQWGLHEDPQNATRQDDIQNNYGSIIFIETGAGKSYISLMLIKSLFGEPHDKLAELSPEKLKEKRLNNVGGMLYGDQQHERKKVVFIVPTNNLVDQQSSVIERYTERVRVGKFQGGKNNKKVYKYENWIQNFRDNDVFVFIAKKFYDLLMHGYIKISQIDLLILDEAHHTNQEHLYNLIMTDFYYANYNPNLEKRPKILALTASPIKHKIEASKIYKHEIKEFLQSLADNLYSKFVSVSADDLNEMRNECKIEVMTYESLFEFNARTVKDIEQHLILNLLKLLSPSLIPPGFYKVIPHFGGAFMSQQQQEEGARNQWYQNILSGINSFAQEEFKMQQDTQILKFISTRKKFIDLEVEQSKKIDLKEFHSEDRSLILLIIMLVKNINNLIVELGMLGFQLFLIDLRRDLLERQSQKFKSKGKQIIEIFNKFIDELIAKEMMESKSNQYDLLLQDEKIFNKNEYEQQIQFALSFSEVSGKVTELVNILEREYNTNNKLKAIVFVKDRSVATYLKKILDFMFARAHKQRMEHQSLILDKSFQNMVHNNASDCIDQEMIDSTLDGGHRQRFRCNFAIGFQGKSITNKAYRSTKTIEDEISQLDEFLPQFSHVKMTHQNLMKNIEDFKNDKINILIATSVIEEGLDVSSCNLVISINEVLNVKSFIQTKGRARQKNSKFIFLCAEEEKKEVTKTIEGFNSLILKIQEIAYCEDALDEFGQNRDNQNIILPSPNIIYQKQKQEWMYLITKPPFMAKCTMREAPQILELLCNELLEELNSSRIKENDLRPNGMQMTEQQKELMAQGDMKRQKRKIVVNTDEYSIAETNKQFKSRMYLPEYLKYFFYTIGGVIHGDRGFSKKREAENYVNLIAVKQLYAYGLYGEDLYPNLSRFLNQKFLDIDLPEIIKLPQPKQPIVNEQPAAKPNKPQPAPQVQQIAQKQLIKVQVSEQLLQDKKQLQSQKDQFTKEFKKSSLPVPVYSVYLDKSLKPQNQQNIAQEQQNASLSTKQPQSSKISSDKIMIECGVPEPNLQINMKDKQIYHILVFQGADTQYHREIETQSSFSLRRKIKNNHQLKDSYPQKNMNEFLGILWDRELNSSELNLFIELQQENRQKSKNTYYLEKLCELGLISKQQKDQMIQSAEILEIRIESIEFDFKSAMTMQKIKFFHYWFFYFVNNASQRFYKKLFQGLFTFVDLFTPVISFLKKAAKNQRKLLQTDFLEYVFKIDFAKQNQQIIDFNINTYIIPICLIPKRKQQMIMNDERQQRFMINWNLIDQLISYAQSDLLSICLTDNTEKHQVINKYDLFEAEGTVVNTVRNIWSCESNQNIFVVMNAPKSKDKLYNISPQYLGVNKKQDQNLLQKQYSITLSHLTLDLSNDMYWYYKQIAQHCYSNNMNRSYSILNQSLNSTFNNSKSYRTSQKLDSQSIPENNFIKTGVYLSLKENQYLYKCSKERCLLDFSVQKSTIINNQAEESKNNGNHKPQNQQQSTLFDVPQQLMRRVPLNYEQYQLLLTSNFCYASLVEISKVIDFINDFFTDLKIHTEDPEGFLNLQQWPLTPRLEDFAKNSSSLVQQSDLLSDFIKEDFMLLVEAMTAPTANKPIDYERLEFYGDSVISFLVILELYVTTACGERDYKEGELDFFRIKAVSNMNLTKTNTQYQIFKYIITDSTKVIADELIPPGFTMNEYQLKVKQKTTNEMKCKLGYLKKCELILQQRICRGQTSDIVNQEYIDIVTLFLLQPPLYNLLDVHNPQAWEIYEQERTRFNSFSQPFYPKHKLAPPCNLIWRVAERWMYELGISIDNLRLCAVQNNIDKVEGKYKKDKDKRIQNVAKSQSNKGKNNKKKQVEEQKGDQNEKMRHFQSKQLADTVESITGAIAQAAGLFSSQDFLFKIGVLKYSKQKQEEELEKMINNEIQCQGYQVLIQKHKDRFSFLQDLIGYQFKNPCLLVQAMVHKSFKEHFNTMKEHQNNPKMHIDDYERLEFLGDSILNFLIAQYYFMKTKDNPSENQPKQLHKLKTSVVNNVFLSLIVVQRGIHEFVLYNQNSEQFKKQIDQYIDVVKDILAKSLVESENEEMEKDISEVLNDQEYANLNIEPLYEYSLKIFGDIFESLIGAIFLDCKSISKTERVLQNMMKPFLKMHMNVDTLEDHSRTKLLELWNSKPYARNAKIKHIVDQKPDGSAIFHGTVNRVEVRRITFQKDMKNKVRRFYNDFYDFIEAFVRYYESNGLKTGSSLEKELEKFRQIYQPPQKDMD